MKKLFEELNQILNDNQFAVLVTVIASSGSTPRGAGSRMLVRQDGTTRGTIGGGAVEYRAIQTALEAMKQKTSRIQGFTLTRSQVSDIGMVCGGNVEVYFQYVDGAAGTLKTLCRSILAAFERDEDSWLILDITDTTCWQMGLYSEGTGAAMMGCPAEDTGTLEAELLKDTAPGKAFQTEHGGRRYYLEPLVQAGKVYIFGGGHVAQELVPVLHHLGFRCVVVDDRPEFANPQVFPQAEQTMVGDLEHISEYLSIRPCDSVCIMTRGHQYDYYLQRQILPLKPRYIGIMGSRNKIRVVTDKLLEDGFAREEIEACHMPIGMAIHAETPAEIAISIAGELVKVHREPKAG